MWGITTELSRQSCNCTMREERNFTANQSARHSVSHYISSDEGIYNALCTAANYIKYCILRSGLAESLEFAPTYETRAYQLLWFCNNITGFIQEEIGVYLRFSRYLCIYVWMDVCMYVSMYVCMYVWMDGWKDGEMHEDLHSRVDEMYGNINRQIYKEVLIYYVYIYIHTHVYVRTYIHTRIPPYKYT